MTGEQALDAVMAAESHDDRTHEDGQVEIITAGELVNIDDFVFVITGEIVQSNFQEVAKQIKQNISQIGEELETEEDFELASNVAEKLREAAKALEEKRQQAFKKADALYSELKAIEDVEGECSAKALALEKLVTAEKQRKKNNLVNEHFVDALTHYNEARDKWPDFALCSPWDEDFSELSFRLVVKNCRSFKSMADRLTNKANDVKAEINTLVDSIFDNGRTIDAAGNKAIFPDRKNLLMMSDELLRATIQGRIATHEAEELKKQQEADRLEREAKEQKEADDAAEAQRIAAEAAEIAEEGVRDDVDTVAALVDQANDVEQNESTQDSQRRIDNNPPFGFANGSPVPIVRKSKTAPQAENLAPRSDENPKPDQPADPNLVQSFRLEADLTCTVGRAKEIAGIIHGRVKKLDEVHRVVLRDASKPSKEVTAIIDELKRVGHHEAAQIAIDALRGNYDSNYN